MPLFKNFILAFPYHLRKEEPLPSPLVAICGTIVYGKIFLKVKFLRRA